MYGLTRGSISRYQTLFVRPHILEKLTRLTGLDSYIHVSNGVFQQNRLFADIQPTWNVASKPAAWLVKDKYCISSNWRVIQTLRVIHSAPAVQLACFLNKSIIF